MTYLSHYVSPLGPMTMASDGSSLIGLWFDGQKYDRANINKVELIGSDLPIFDQAKRWLDEYFKGAIPSFTPPLKLTGSAFRQHVLQQLTKIPYGHTMTYGDIAKIIAQERANNTSSGDLILSRASRGAQAIGGAVGHNPISIIIPCHRVLGANGSLTGYAGGLHRKLWLLNHERQHSSDK